MSWVTLANGRDESKVPASSCDIVVRGNGCSARHIALYAAQPITGTHTEWLGRQSSIATAYKISFNNSTRIQFSVRKHVVNFQVFLTPLRQANQAQFMWHWFSAAVVPTRNIKLNFSPSFSSFHQKYALTSCNSSPTAICMQHFERVNRLQPQSVGTFIDEVIATRDIFVSHTAHQNRTKNSQSECINDYFSHKFDNGMAQQSIVPSILR